MFKISLAFVLAIVVVATASAEEPCQEKPCSREYRPVSVTDEYIQCHEFPNLCVLENAIHCNRIKPIECMKGSCENNGVMFTCPDGIW